MRNYPKTPALRVMQLPESLDQSELNDKGLYVYQSLIIPLTRQLIKFSKQPHIVEYCPNDSGGRFHNLYRAAKWQNKGRLALPLVSRVGKHALKLEGFGWMGPQMPGKKEPEISGAKTTFAIRLYEDAVGKHNSLPYTLAILQAHNMFFGNEGVWLEAWGDNVSALKTYERAGFQKVAEIPGERHGREFPRIYMTLGKLTCSNPATSIT